MKLVKLLEEIELSKEDCDVLRQVMNDYSVEDLRYALSRAQRQRERDEDSTYNLRDTH
jgi:hypothetical protein